MPTFWILLVIQAYPSHLTAGSGGAAAGCDDDGGADGGAEGGGDGGGAGVRRSGGYDGSDGRGLDGGGWAGPGAEQSGSDGQRFPGRAVSAGHAGPFLVWF